MNRPHRILIPREYTAQDGEQKTAWTEIGAAWPSRSGEGFNCILYALPAAATDKNGNVITRFSIFPPRDDDRQQAPPQQQTRQSTHAEPLDDEIPF